MEKIKILIVEDENFIVQGLKMGLELKGYSVCSFVASGEEAIIEAAKKNPDVILMDINLSGQMDGIQAAEEIIKSKFIPIIFITGYADPGLFARAHKINPAAYVEKPVEICTLIPIIDAAVSR